ncbi:MAG: hypothetical protein CME47_08690 [Halieaceae bacterium]|nr:hypothetical protein [Halieaceae bacterium]
MQNLHRQPILESMSFFNTRPIAAMSLAVYWLLFATIISRADNRQLTTQADAAWEGAIVKIEVPIVRSVKGYPRHFLERCSATIISPGPRPVLISAWHCFEGYDAMASPAQTLTKDGPVSLELLASGGSMQNDWALLTSKADWIPTAWIPIARDRAEKGARVSAAGFSRPPASGSTDLESPLDRALVIDSDCRVAEASSPPIASSCVIQQGASGGAILGRTQSGSLRVYGVISAGDSKSVSYFYPADLLLSRIRP